MPYQYQYKKSIANIAHTFLFHINNNADDNLASYTQFLADRTNGRAIGTVLRLSVVCLLSVALCIVAKRCVLEVASRSRQPLRFDVEYLGNR